MTDRPADTTPVAWRAVIYLTPIAAADGHVVGHVREVLGSDAEDVFHGIRVGLSAGSRDVLLGSDHVRAMSAAKVETDLAVADFAALPTYAEEATYHLASVGWLRKHLGWTRDSGKDEEPG
jgi:hypothetical protein